MKELTADAFEALAQRFKADEKLHNEFMVRSIGFHPSDPEEVKTAYAIFLDRGLAVQRSETDANDLSLWPHICTMTSNIAAGEYAQCASQDPTMS